MYTELLFVLAMYHTVLSLLMITSEKALDHVNTKDPRIPDMTLGLA